MFIEICSSSYLISVGWKLQTTHRVKMPGRLPSFRRKIVLLCGLIDPSNMELFGGHFVRGGETNDRACRHSIAMTTLQVQDGSSMFISFVRIHVQRWRTWRMPRSSLVGKAIPSFPALCALPCAIQATLLHPSRWNAIWESSRQQNFRANLTLASFTWFRTV